MVIIICVSGVIGAGKSTLSEMIGSHFGTEVFYESVDDNPILPLYYKATDEEIEKNRYPFQLQLWFLNSRFKSIKKALCNDNNVLDRSIYEDWYFAKKNFDLGKINEYEMKIYENLLHNMLEQLEELPKKAPDLMIYLKVSFETVLKRIRERGREYELDDKLIDYYYDIWKDYDDWIFNHYNASRILVIDTEKYNYANNEEHKKEVLKMIERKLNEIRK